MKKVEKIFKYLKDNYEWSAKAIYGQYDRSLA